MSFLENLNWRYATKKFDKTKKISLENLQTIRNAIRMAPSSFGLQMFLVIEVVDLEIRAKIREASYNQPQVTDADRIFIFVARNDVENRINQMFIKLNSQDLGISKAHLLTHEETVRSVMLNSELMTKEKLFTLSNTNLGIALGFALAACAELKVDACPMEGFDVQAVKKILNLSDDFLPVAYLTVGYRDESDYLLKIKKFRFSEEEIFKKI